MNEYELLGGLHEVIDNDIGLKNTMSIIVFYIH